MEEHSSDLDHEIFTVVNRFRTDPQTMVPHLEKILT
jgi:hypothetical protein